MHFREVGWLVTKRQSQQQQEEEKQEEEEEDEHITTYRITLHIEIHLFGASNNQK